VNLKKRIYFFSIILLILLIGFDVNAQGLKAGEKAPDFALSYLLDENKMFTLSDFIEEETNKLIILVFAAQWCPPCKNDLPLLETFHKKYAEQGVKILLIETAEKKNNKLKKYFKKENLPFPVFYDKNNLIAKKYKLIPIPCYFFISKEGIIKYFQRGSISKGQENIFEKNIVELIKNKIMTIPTINRPRIGLFTFIYKSKPGLRMGY